MKSYRHGDVVVTPVDAIPAEAKKLNRKELAYGEVSGHAHRVDVGELFETKDGKLYLRVDHMSNLTHEEHRRINLPPGCYRVTQKRQYSPENGTWEAVRD